MTEKIYETDSFRKELKTTVTECIKEADSVYIKLKETIFFPEEGGQYSDTGTLQAGSKTVRILKGELLGSPTEGETDIRYLADGEIDPGTEVLCKLDWGIRFDRMQNHSGEHILSGLINGTFGFNNVGFHLSDTDPVTLDFDGLLDTAAVSELEKRANEAIWADLPVKDSYPSKEELAGLSYRSKLDIRAQVRIITIGDENRTVDVCACCAPHVKRTGAIGILKILSSETLRGGTRLHMLCGRRAYEYICRDLEALNRTAVSLSVRGGDVPGIVASLKEELLSLHSRNAALTERMILSDIRSGVFQNLVFTDLDLSPGNMKNIYNELTSLKEGCCGVFAGNDEEGYRYYAGGGKTDARLLAKRMKEVLNAKGGGSAEMIQGKTAASREELEVFFREYNAGL